MNQNSQAHPDFDNEQKFDKKKRGQLIKYICKVMEENGIPKGAIILADYLNDAERQEQEEREKKQRKRKSVFIVVCVFVAVWIFVTCGAEWLCRILNLSGMWRKNLQYAPLLVESGFVFINALIERRKAPKSPRLRKDGEGIAEGMIEWAKDLGHQFSRASGLHVCILFMFITLAATVIAQCEPMKHINVFFSGGINALAHYDDNNNVTDSIMLANGGADKISVSYEIKQYLSSADEMMIKQLDEAEVTNEQKNMELQLSIEDEYSIFTCWENELGEFETQEQMNIKVLSAVQGWCGKKFANVFDGEPEQGGASQKNKDEISEISENEQPDDSFSEVEDRLDFRESMAKVYPKRTLMQLVANDYQGLALRLVWHEGVQSTIIYYYGQSILFNIECLKFADNTDKTIKERLTIIAQRYEDIAYVCPNYERVGEARILAEAFRYAADQY